LEAITTGDNFQKDESKFQQNKGNKSYKKASLQYTCSQLRLSHDCMATLHQLLNSICRHTEMESLKSRLTRKTFRSSLMNRQTQWRIQTRRLGGAKNVFTCLNTKGCLRQKMSSFVGQKVAIFLGRNMLFFREKPQFENAL